MAGRPDIVRVDVVVVGAGPAGTATAISCAQAGLEVVILDREPSPRDRPGETLHPGIEAPLRSLGVLERVSRASFPRHRGIRVHWNSSPRFEPYGADRSGPWRGYQAWGAELDAILLERAVELGVEVLRPRRALAPLVLDGRVCGIETSGGRIDARYVVDGAGSRHWLARRLGLTVRRRSPRLIARYGYREGACPIRDAAPVIVADERGWTWTAKVRDNLYHWTRLNVDAGQPEPTFVPKELRELSPRGTSRGADVSWRIVDKPAGPGYFLAGDAAAVLDPASSHGVLKAMLSGMLASHLIIKAFIHSDVVDVSRDYNAWIHGRFEHDIAGLRTLYARLPRPPRWVQTAESL